MSASPAEIAILVVDDEPRILDIWVKFFRLLGYSVDTASGVGEARRILAERDYDVLITDLNMPGGSGLELLSYLDDNGAEGRKNMKICVSSGYRDQFRERVHDYGVDRVIDKPFEFKNEMVFFRELLGELSQTKSA